MYKLVIEDIEASATEIPLVRDEITIGRNEGNTVRLPERNVSRRHARIFKSDSDVLLEDAGSRYGIRVNGARVDERVRLAPGDHIKIGDYEIALLLEGEETGPVAPQPVPRDGDAPFDDDEPMTEVLRASDFVSPSASAPPAGGPRQAQLIVLSGNVEKATYPLEGQETLVGREGDVDIIIDHASMSRTHAKILFNGKLWSIVDQGSANGVKINGEDVGARDLRNGDVVELGEVKLRFVRRDQQGALEGKVADYHVRQAAERRKKLVVGLVVGLLLSAWALSTVWRSDPEEKPAAALPSASITAPSVDPLVDALQLARGFIAQRRWDSALLHLEEAMRLDPGNADAARLRSRARAEALNKQTFEELQAAVTVREISLIDTKLQAIGADSIYRGDAIDVAASLVVERVAHHVREGDQAQEAGKIRIALGHYEAALRADPMAVEARRGRTLIRVQLKSQERREGAASNEASPTPANPPTTATSPGAAKEDGPGEGGGDGDGGGGDVAVGRDAATASQGAAAKPEAPTQQAPAEPGARKGGGAGDASAPTSKKERKRQAMLAYAKARNLLRSEPKAAVSMLKRSLRLDPRMAKPHRLLGNYYAEQGKPAKACKHLKKFLKLSPRHPDGEAIRGQLSKFGCGD